MDIAAIKNQEFMILFIEWALSTLKNVCLAFTPSILVAKIPFQVIQNKPHFSALDNVSVEDNDQYTL